MAPRSINQMAQLTDGSLLVATTTGVFHLTGTSWEAVATPEIDFAVPITFGPLAMNAAGDVWLAYRRNLYHYANGVATLRRSFPADISGLLVNDDGSVLCGVNDGRLAEIRTRGEPQFLDFGAVTWHSLLRTRNGDVWASAQQGLYRLRGSDRLHLGQADGLVNTDVDQMLEDREGNLWVGSNGGGLMRLRPSIARIHSTENGLPSNDTMSVMEDRKGQIWAGSFKGGVSVWTAGNWAPFRLPADASAERNVVSLLESRDGKIWFGGFRFPHFCWDGREVAGIPWLTFESVRVLFEDRDGGIWVGSDQLGLAHHANGQTHLYNEATGLSGNTITAVAQDSTGAIWAGTARGLDRIDAGRITAYSRSDGLGGNQIKALYADAAGAVWIGSSGGGLTRWKGGRFSTLTTEQGLPTDIVCQLVEDDDGYIWMGTTAGIFRARRLDLEAGFERRASFVPTTSFGRSEGLREVECAGGFQPACMKARDGSLWFCTIGGVVNINPKLIRPNPIPPPTLVERVVLDEQSHAVSGAGSAAAQELIVPPGTARMEIHYVGLSFVAAEKVRFKYFLEGYDSDWVQAGARRVALFTHVPPGRYRFHVTAANNDGVWNETGATLAMWVQPQFWQTLWFRLLIGVTVLGSLVGFDRLRTAHARRVQALRQRIAHDLHDDAGSNLANIRLLSRRAAKLLQRRENAAFELTEIERVSAATSESLRDVVWLIDPRFDTLDQMLEEMESRAAQVLAEANCRCRWNVARSNRTLSLEFRTNFFLLFKEILHNVQKHAGATKVEIELTELDGAFVLRVRDNGVGFDSGVKARGHGLASLRRRAGLLHGRAIVESQPGQGATVTVTVRSP